MPRTIALRKRGLEKSSEFEQLDQIYQNCREKIASLKLKTDQL